mmetsp:Transcript_19844/g.62475  ORF Transcript_19844/g.62475 Transcript_19844/m.62475 type:complete len:215 (-) Transcript_19844:84-728(-)
MPPPSGSGGASSCRQLEAPATPLRGGLGGLGCFEEGLEAVREVVPPEKLAAERLGPRRRSGGARGSVRLVGSTDVLLVGRGGRVRDAEIVALGAEAGGVVFERDGDGRESAFAAGFAEPRSSAVVPPAELAEDLRADVAVRDDDAPRGRAAVDRVLDRGLVPSRRLVDESSADVAVETAPRRLNRGRRCRGDADDRRVRRLWIAGLRQALIRQS